MVIFIRLYPILAICMAIVCFDFARTLRRKGRKEWYYPAMFLVVSIISIVLWVVYRGDQNAEAWAKALT